MAAKIDGLNELVRGLRRFSPELSQELKRLNRDVAEDLAPVAKSFAPVRSGRLAGSVRAGATLRSGVVRAGGAGVPYAGVIHFGSPRRGIKPRPFLYDALDDRRGEIERRFAEGVAKLADKVTS